MPNDSEHRASSPFQPDNPVHTICHIITKLELGGAQEVALYTVSHLDRTKFISILVAGPGGLLTDEASQLPGVRTIIVPFLGRQIHVISDLLALFKLMVLFRRLRPSIVHTHSSKAGILGRWAAWFAGVPVIVHTVHGFGITPAQSRWFQRLLILLERMTGWVTTHWVTVATVDAGRGREWGLFHSNVSVIRPGIDPLPFQQALEPAVRRRIREEFGAGDNHYLIGAVACMKPQKAPEDFLSVAQRVCEQVPQARFVMIGDGELRPRVEALIRHYGLHDRVALAGWRRDIDRAMNSLDALLLTSHWEGLPRVILEATCAGLPIVATDVGGVGEVAGAGDQVRLCRAGDIARLAAELEQLVHDPERGVRTPVGHKGKLPREFHIEEMVKRYESLYDRLLSFPRKKLTGNIWSPTPQL